jgi:transposase-like protein
MGTLVEIIALVKAMPESHLEKTLEKVKEIKEEADSEEGATQTRCPHCQSGSVKRNGKKRDKQQYLCLDCRKSFASTAKSAIQNSHSSVAAWKQVISDTVNGVSIDRTADNLDLHHGTVFNMRHKILYVIEQSLIANPTELAGVCETDETYVLESVKGKKIPADYHRKPRKHGAKAAKRGISDEYICVMSSVTSNNENVAVAVNRATPSCQEIFDVFGERVNGDTVVLCDGNLNYDTLEEKCTVAHTKRVNRVNGFHSFIKERLDGMRGVATSYLNRYNALFAKIYAADNTVVDDIFALMTSQSGKVHTIAHTQSENLLSV